MNRWDFFSIILLLKNHTVSEDFHGPAKKKKEYGVYCHLNHNNQGALLSHSWSTNSTITPLRKKRKGSFLSSTVFCFHWREKLGTFGEQHVGLRAKERKRCPQKKYLDARKVLGEKKWKLNTPRKTFINPRSPPTHRVPGAACSCLSETQLRTPYLT